MRKLLLFITIVVCGGVRANVRMPNIFANEMVLQRNQPVPVWGWADPGEKITVSFRGVQKKGMAGKDGKWMVRLDALVAGGPDELVIRGKNVITLRDVLVGEVWVCSGQSNMEMPIAGWGKINHYEQEIRDADYPQIRQYLVAKSISTVPKDDAEGVWSVCSPATAGNFTAAASHYKAG